MDLDAPTPTSPGYDDTSDGGILAGLAVIVLLGGVLAAYLLLSNGPTEVEVASPTSTTTTTQPAVSDPATPVDPEPAVVEDSSEPADVAIPSIRDAGAGDAAFGGGQSLTVHTSSGFGTLVQSNGGTLARTSTDGLEWEQQSTTGIPSQAHVTELTATADQFVVALQEWPSFDDIPEDEVFFEPDRGPELSIATSTDFLVWDATVLPPFGPDAKYGTSEFVAGLAAGDDTVVALITVIENAPDPLRLLADAGLIDESEFNSFCGFDWDAAQSGEPIAVYRCDHEAEELAHLEFEEALSAAESDEERQAIEREFERNFIEPEREEIAVIEPGTELYAEFRLLVREDEGGRGSTLALYGPSGGPYTTTELPTDGFPIGIVAVSDGFVAAVNAPTQRETVFLHSATGSDWAELSRIDEAGIYQLAAVGQTVVAAGGDFDGIHVFASASGGESWTRADIGTDLFQAYGLVVDGPAGIAIGLEGSTEPYEQLVPPPLEVSKNGYTLVLDYEADRLTLTDSSGTVVQDVSGFIEVFDGEAEGVVESNDGESVTFLDPNSGEPLVTYNEEDFAAAFEDTAIEPPDIEVPPFGRELYFSADGATWRQLEPPFELGANAYPQLAAVGDDEILLSVTTWSEPPAELLGFESEGRDPTDAEIEALDDWLAENDGGGTTEWFRVPISW